MVITTIFFVFTLAFCSSVAWCNEHKHAQISSTEELRGCSCQGDKGKKTKKVSSNNDDETRCGCNHRKKKRSNVDGLNESLKETAGRTCGICISLGQKPPQEPPQDQNQKTKKVDVERLLEGLASACVHAGAVAGAQDVKEQRQAACNLVGSIFFVAAQIAKKDPKKAELPHDYNELTRKQSIRGLFSDKPYLSALSMIDDAAERNEAIGRYVSSTEMNKHFLKELFDVVREFVKDYNSKPNEKMK